MSASARAVLPCGTACQEDFVGDLATISIPVLAIHGDQDRVLPYEATGSRLPALLKNAGPPSSRSGRARSSGPHGDEVNQALLHYIGPAQAGGRHNQPASSKGPAEQLITSSGEPRRQIRTARQNWPICA